MIITCPHCHKKLNATTAQMVIKGRLSLLCPVCHKYIYAALRKQLMAIQAVMVLLAILYFTWLARADIPGGGLVTLLLMMAGTIVILAFGELSNRWIARDSMLRYRTEKALQRERGRGTPQKGAQRKKKKK